MAPLIARSRGPDSEDPFGDDLGGRRLQPWPECLPGAVVEGFSLVVYKGGAVDELITCAESQGITALYALHDAEFVPYVIGAPEIVNRPFYALFPGAVPPLLPLVVRGAEPVE